MEIFFEETKSSYAARIYMLWHTYRQGVIKFFPEPSSLKERKTYFAELKKSTHKMLTTLSLLKVIT